MSTPSDRRAKPAIAIRAGVGRGLAFAIGAALISGLAIYLNAFAVKQLPDAAVFTTLKNAIAAIILIAVALGLGAARDVRLIDRRSWPAVLAVGVIGGSVPFILFFTGLAQASAPSAASSRRRCSYGLACWPCRSSASAWGSPRSSALPSSSSGKRSCCRPMASGGGRARP